MENLYVNWQQCSSSHIRLFAETKMFGLFYGLGCLQSRVSNLRNSFADVCQVLMWTRFCWLSADTVIQRDFNDTFHKWHSALGTCYFQS